MTNQLRNALKVGIFVLVNSKFNQTLCLQILSHWGEDFFIGEQPGPWCYPAGVPALTFIFGPASQRQGHAGYRLHPG